MRAPPAVPWTDTLDEQLQSTEFTLLYLNEILHEDGFKDFLSALNDVVRARGGNVSQLTKRADISREHLYRMLSPRGNPAFSKVVALMEALGLRITIEEHPKRKKRAKRKTVAKKPTKRASVAPSRRRPHSPPLR